MIYDLQLRNRICRAGLASRFGALKFITGGSDSGLLLLLGIDVEGGDDPEHAIDWRDCPRLFKILFKLSSIEKVHPKARDMVDH